MQHPSSTAFLLSALAMLVAPGVAVAAAACSAQSAAIAPRVVELYTSEGCSSCPPADRWLSGLDRRQGVIALAFHVDYWDRLGWSDRFASAEWTRRQREVSARSGARFVYTPQVLVDGREHRRWNESLPPPGGAAPVTLRLAREGAVYTATVQRLAGAPAALSGYWALTEDGHRTQVRSGENAGAVLHHDGVVRELLPVASLGDDALRFTPQGAKAGAATARRVQFVVTDAQTGKPLQALALDC